MELKSMSTCGFTRTWTRSVSMSTEMIYKEEISIHYNIIEKQVQLTSAIDP